MKTLPSTFVKTLGKAVQLNADGRPADAAPQLAKLAAAAENADFHRRSGNLHALAAAAYADSGDEAKASLHTQKALRVMIDQNLIWRAPAFYQAITRKIEAKRWTKTIDALRTHFSQSIVIMSGEQRKEPLPQGRLPERCPGCGVAMRSDEVDWITRARAECDFCGTVVDAV